MVPALFFYQLLLIALIWLCVMLHWVCPSAPAMCPTTPEPTPLPPTPHPGPKPIEALTTKHHCDTCQSQFVKFLPRLHDRLTATSGGFVASFPLRPFAVCSPSMTNGDA